MTQTKLKSTSANKTTYIKELFTKISKKYDLLNNLMTFGRHYKWKEYTIKLALKENNSPREALDLCSGTGDLAIILNRYSPNTKISCVDNCSEMLEIAQAKIQKLKTKNILLLLSDTEQLVLQPSLIDLVTIGFGLRNILNKEKCIEDIYKLLKPGGVFACIDLGYPTNYIWQKTYSYYFFNVIPALGSLFAGNKEAYNYLVNSLMDWYKQEELKKLILQKGFQKCYFKNILGGVVAIHIAVK